MSENTNVNNTVNENTSNCPIPPIPKDTSDFLTLQYILEQIEKIQSQTDYLFNAVEALKNVGGDGVGMGAGNIVEEREKTNRQLISFYEKMYDDLRKNKILEQKEIILSTAIQSLADGITPVESSTTLHDIVELALKDINETK